MKLIDRTYNFSAVDGKDVYTVLKCPEDQQGSDTVFYWITNVLDKERTLPLELPVGSEFVELVDSSHYIFVQFWNDCPAINPARKTAEGTYDIGIPT